MVRFLMSEVPLYLTAAGGPSRIDTSAFPAHPCAQHCPHVLQGYLTYKKTPLGPYLRPMPRVLGGTSRGGRFLMGDVPMYSPNLQDCSFLRRLLPPHLQGATPNNRQGSACIQRRLTGSLDWVGRRSPSINTKSGQMRPSRWAWRNGTLPLPAGRGAS